MNKTETRKSAREYYALSRSQVALGKKLGTRDMKSAKDYDRKKDKAMLKREYR